MTVRLYASVVVDGKVEHVGFTLDADAATSVKDLFDHADAKTQLGPRLFQRLLDRAETSAVTVLHNGRRLCLPEDLGNAVKDGDEVTLLTPLAGG